MENFQVHTLVVVVVAVVFVLDIYLTLTLQALRSVFTESQLCQFFTWVNDNALCVQMLEKVM